MLFGRSVQITGAAGAELFVGPPDAPTQVVRVTYTGGSVPFPVTIEGPDVHTPHAVTAEPSVGEATVEVPVLTRNARPGQSLPARARAGEATHDFQLTVAEPGWTMFMISHFHYDPVWWTTQAAYTSTWQAPPGPARQTHSFDLVRAHLDLARREPEYKFVLAEVDYLKPYWDAHPQDRDELRALIAAGRVEIMGGTYNEPNTNLTSPETTIRNFVHGVGFQHGVLGASPATAWQLDAFGHDPAFPGMAADAGLTSSSWARGPHHQWGPMQVIDGVQGDPERMQFRSEFEWISPSGRGLLTHYMPAHYSAGWWMDASTTLAEAEEATYALFLGLKKVATTRNVLLPVGTDYTPPNRWVTQIHRSFAARYSWPRFVCATPSEFFAAVRAELAYTGARPSPQTRDMNPVYTGKDVSFVDTKQANRAAEHAVLDAETFAVFAGLLTGVAYPQAALAKAWVQLVYGAHHDAITGSESDQVYLDLLTSWRDAWELGATTRDRALRALSALVDGVRPTVGAPVGATTDGRGGVGSASGAASGGGAASGVGSRAGVGPGRDDDTVALRRGDDTVALRRADASAGDVRVVVWNPVARARADVVTVRLPATAAGWPGVRVLDADGRALPALVEHDGATVSFLARDVPSLGWRSYRVTAAESDWSWHEHVGTTIANEHHRLRVDPQRGGGVASLVEVATGRELIGRRRVGNELAVYEEYPQHPEFGEGPWHLTPKGPVVTSAAAPAESVRLLRSAIGQRVVVTGAVGELRYTQTITLWHGVDRVDCATTIDEFTGADRLVRVRWPCPVPGAMPVSEVGDAVIGRGFALLHDTAGRAADGSDEERSVDTHRHPWTLDNPAWRWFGLSSAARVKIGSATRSIGVAEVVTPSETASAPLARGLVVALARAGVTATTSAAVRPRYGDLAVDSNLPDVRIALGGPRQNAFTAALLAEADPVYAAEVERQLQATGTARVWVPAAAPLAVEWAPGADLTFLRSLPVLVIAGHDDPSLGGAVAALADDLADAVVEVAQDAPADPEPYESRTVALLNRGVPSFAVDTEGTLHTGLMRACTGWPSGVWIDPPRRTAPDGSNFQLQHWTHVFEYALVSGVGDWRATDVPARSAAWSNPLLPIVVPPPGATAGAVGADGTGPTGESRGAGADGHDGGDDGDDAAGADTAPVADSADDAATADSPPEPASGPAIGPTATSAPAGQPTDAGADGSRGAAAGRPGGGSDGRGSPVVTGGSRRGRPGVPAPHPASTPLTRRDGGSVVRVADGAAALPASGSLLQVEPAGAVHVTAVKAAGNPLAAGSIEPPDLFDAVTLRLVEGKGGHTPVTVRSAIGRIVEAVHADLLERPGRQITNGSRELRLTLQPYEIATVLARLEAPAPAPGAEPQPIAPEAEVAQPLYARYWLHNRGPAPLGGLPAVAHVRPTHVAAAPGDDVELRVSIASDCADATLGGDVTLVLPDGWEFDAPPGWHGRSLPFELAAGDHAETTVRLVAPAIAGHHPVRVQLALRGDDVPAAWRQVVEDVCVVTITVPVDADPTADGDTGRGPDGGGDHDSGDHDSGDGPDGGAARDGDPPADDTTTGDGSAATDGGAAVEDDTTGDEPPGSDAVAAARADDTAADTTDGSGADDGPGTVLRLDSGPEPVEVAAGSAARVAVVVATDATADLAVEAHVISPWGTWEWIGPAAVGAVLPARGAVELAFAVTPPPGTAPGTWWALVRVAAAGRLVYSPAVAVVVT